MGGTQLQKRPVQKTGIYETTVTTAGRKPPIDFTFMSVPRRMMGKAGGALLSRPGDLLPKLGVEQAEEALISELPWWIFDLLLAAESGDHTGTQRSLGWLKSREGPVQELYSLAEYLAFAPIVTFELSPREEHSLAELAVKSAGHMSGAIKGVAELGKAALGVNIVTTGAGLVGGHAGAAVAAAGAIITPVVFQGLVYGVGAVVVVDGIGVVVGLAGSPKIRKRVSGAVNLLRKGLAGLLGA